MADQRFWTGEEATSIEVGERRVERGPCSAQDAEQDAAPQIRPRWWVEGLTGGGSVVEVVKAR